MTIADIKKKVTPVLRRHDVEFAGIFGSYARGEQKPGSDVDILIRFANRKSLLEHIRLDRELSEILQRPVDTVTERSLHPYIQSNVLQDLDILYGSR